MKHLANILTISRVAAAVVMLLPSTGSPSFWCLYAWCGLSDMADGTLARRSGSSSEFGARLDSAADAVFVMACLVKLLPVLPFSLWLIIWIALIGLRKIATLIMGFAKHRQVASPHTTANKVAGLAVFLSTPALFFSGCALLAAPACAIATFAAIQEAHLV